MCARGHPFHESLAEQSADRDAPVATPLHVHGPTKYKCIKVFFFTVMLTVEVLPTPSVYFDFLILPLGLHIRVLS